LTIRIARPSPLIIKEEQRAPMTGTERRLAKRFGFKIPIRVRIPKSSAPEQRVESLNVSARGICFTTDLPLQKGASVHLVFEMPEEVSHKPTSEGHCTGHVVHIQANGSLQRPLYVGVAFDCYEVLPTAHTSATKLTSAD
jgi:hypothetical protein